MGNYTIFGGFEIPRKGRQARNFSTNVPKILHLKSSSEQIFSKNCPWVPLTPSGLDLFIKENVGKLAIHNGISNNKLYHLHWRMLWFHFILGCYYIFLFLNNHTLPYPKTKGNKLEPKKNLNHICAHLNNKLV